MDYLVFAEDLARYDLADIEAGLDRLKRRLEYEPAFPHLDMMEQAIKGVIRERKAAARRQAEADAEAAAAKHRRDHPELYEPVRDVWAAVNERAKGMRKMPDAAPQSADVSETVQPENNSCAPQTEVR